MEKEGKKSKLKSKQPFKIHAYFDFGGLVLPHATRGQQLDLRVPCCLQNASATNIHTHNIAAPLCVAQEQKNEIDSLCFPAFVTKLASDFLQLTKTQDGVK